LIEELAELAEALRFNHLYPSNFDNEMADFFAWWFALLSSVHKAKDIESGLILGEEILWSVYPACCPQCMLSLCDCRPGPVREMLSKPSLDELSLIDALTQASNRRSYDEDVAAIKDGNLPFPIPIACIRIDVDFFKRINDEYSHADGDRALKHLANVIRQKVRPRDRLYRVGGDEFAILCPDLSSLEAQGAMTRLASALKNKPIVANLKNEGGRKDIVLTLSIGIAECNALDIIKAVFELADAAAIKSKDNGRDQITLHVD
jgi:diguanylate cyclase (GGDEF)-like protein